MERTHVRCYEVHGKLRPPTLDVHRRHESCWLSCRPRSQRRDGEDTEFRRTSRLCVLQISVLNLRFMAPMTRMTQFDFAFCGGVGHFLCAPHAEPTDDF